ncbi:MAG TPA: hypothetical protein PLJ27_26905 [Polyangiaceae bacterium]|jgi:hypothetical protein|nr:MAG: hypothetical protein BWY17_02677 [Deltaproteobacteria bacterium ADurb.Bin207]HNS97631.1 hypothetical protein [Polyangiaceae bacterium]HNZ24109.1 hypothetical protein [Polyangiaceae bacterium]HOD23579.1 hypothetical protein [Polyangiaceae bacterium]HOE48799.1 hypothetical protein [Polyangiaceae bacterium]
MSIHRPKRVSFRSDRESESSLDPQEKNRPESWSAAVQALGDNAQRPYSIKETYSIGQGLTHPKFGLGVVVEVESAKIAVLFESGERRLAHAMT